MGQETAFITGSSRAPEALTALVEADGSARHPHVARLLGPGAQRRDLADAVHALCALHGTQPGLADEARRRDDEAYADWLQDTAHGFAAERSLIARLVAAAGPLPSTPGQAATDAALVGQRHALCMLGRSDRAGCSLGAVAALVLDWQAVARVLAAAARQFGAEPQPPRLPDRHDTAALLALGTPATERAMLFGAQQLLAQHRGFWSLLEARAAARDH
jgi:hypothetical protein